MLDQLDCWRKLVGAHLDLKQKITSPFRVDNSPGCFLEEVNGVIRFRDYQQKFLHGADIVAAYAHVYNCSQPLAMAQLKMGYFPPRNQLTVFSSATRPGVQRKGPAVVEIQPFIQKGVPVFTQKHVEFWEKRKVAMETLQGWMNHKVLALHSWGLNGDWQICNELTFCYLFENGHCKIYIPGRKVGKFPAGTTRMNDIWRWEKPENTKLIVDKSFKDGCHNVRLWPDYDTWVFQGERIIPEQLPDFFKYEKIVLKGDNDTPGLKAVSALLDTFKDAKTMFYPTHIKGKPIKDTDDMVINKFEDLAKKLMP